MLIGRPGKVRAPHSLVETVWILPVSNHEQYAGLDPEQVQERQEEIGRIASGMAATLEAAILAPDKIEFIYNLTKTTAEMVRDELREGESGGDAGTESG